MKQKLLKRFFVVILVLLFSIIPYTPIHSLSVCNVLIGHGESGIVAYNVDTNTWEQSIPIFKKDAWNNCENDDRLGGAQFRLTDKNKVQFPILSMYNEEEYLVSGLQELGDYPIVTFDIETGELFNSFGADYDYVYEHFLSTQKYVADTDDITFEFFSRSYSGTREDRDRLFISKNRGMERKEIIVPHLEETSSLSFDEESAIISPNGRYFVFQVIEGMSSDNNFLHTFLYDSLRDTLIDLEKSKWVAPNDPPLISHIYGISNSGTMRYARVEDKRPESYAVRIYDLESKTRKETLIYETTNQSFIYQPGIVSKNLKLSVLPSTVYGQDFVILNSENKVSVIQAPKHLGILKPKVLDEKSGLIIFSYFIFKENRLPVQESEWISLANTIFASISVQNIFTHDGYIPFIRTLIPRYVVSRILFSIL